MPSTHKEKYALKLDGVRRRDGGLCHLCYHPIDFKVQWPDPLAPTLDHIRPRSAGGRYIIPNLKLAHNRCNLMRGNQRLSELKLPLVWK